MALLSALLPRQIRSFLSTIFVVFFPSLPCAAIGLSGGKVATFYQVRDLRTYLHRCRVLTLLRLFFPPLPLLFLSSLAALNRVESLFPIAYRVFSELRIRTLHYNSLVLANTTYTTGGTISMISSLDTRGCYFASNLLREILSNVHPLTMILHRL